MIVDVEWARSRVRGCMYLCTYLRHSYEVGAFADWLLVLIDVVAGDATQSYYNSFGRVHDLGKIDLFSYR